ncbi:MAG TPA: hypothetical protein VE888_04215, partial [Streptosporangiaceae bacterium]|nr:hypothetical protein [Streptosporangiaceae bacterium]
RRVLDMREGAVFRDTVFEDSEGRRTRVETVHFASSAAQHLCCLRARITPENHTAPVIVRSGIDGTGYNLDRRPIYAEPPPVTMAEMEAARKAREEFGTQGPAGH